MKIRFALFAGMLVALILAACSAAPQAAPMESAQEEAAPHEAGPPHWTYEGAEGPDHWGDLGDGAYPLCGTGKWQSPLDISTQDISAHYVDLPDMVFNYFPSDLTILNNGHTVQANYRGGSNAVIDGIHYDLLQFHFHTPSEHTVDGTSYAAELHAVHRNANGELAVVGILIQEGAENPAFDAVIANAPAEKADATTISGVTINLRDMLPEVTHTYRYSGSLTTPPCSEGVSWNLITDPIEMSAAQINRFVGYDANE